MPRLFFSAAYKEFLRVLVAARKEAEVSQVELAERLGKPQQFVSKYETAERRLDLVEFVAVARALKADPRDLFDRVLKKLPKSLEI